MIVGLVHQQECFNRNGALFNPDAYQIGEDLQYPFELLRLLGEKSGIDFCTLDKYSPERYDMVICFDPPKSKNTQFRRISDRSIPKILVLLESKAVQPLNYEMATHSQFSRVYTWNDDMVDSKQYFLLRLANKIPDSLNISIGAKKNAAVMIAGNKSSSFANELYSKRLEEINWCESNDPNAMDLYGLGWDEREFNGAWRHLNRFPFLKRAFVSPPKIWKGKVKSKKLVLRNYKFAIAYENVSGINGYITEKIFDSMFALCIPVYWGAPNIDKLIPKECYIDRKSFSSTEELFRYLQAMEKHEYDNKINSIKRFLSGELIKPFSAENFAATLIGCVQELANK